MTFRNTQHCYVGRYNIYARVALSSVTGCSHTHCQFSPDNVTRITYHTAKGISVPLQVWAGPEDSRKLWLPDYVTTAQDGGRLSALRTGRIYPSRKYSRYSFLLEAESIPGP